VLDLVVTEITGGLGLD